MYCNASLLLLFSIRMYCWRTLWVKKCLFEIWRLFIPWSSWYVHATAAFSFVGAASAVISILFSYCWLSFYLSRCAYMQQTANGERADWAVGAVKVGLQQRSHISDGPKAVFNPYNYCIYRQTCTGSRRYSTRKQHAQLCFAIISTRIIRT